MFTTAYNQFAKEIAHYITYHCDGVNEGFEIFHDGYIAFVNYEAEYREVRGGDSYCGMWEMTSELVNERTTVEAVWDEKGNEYPEIAEALQVLLN